jgi:hypothetical protein
MAITVEAPIQTVGKYRGKHLRNGVKMEENPLKGLGT